MNPRLLRPLASGTFSPATLSGLSGWWDAADASTVTLSGSDATQWNDKSGIGNHLPGVSGNEPTYVADALNGKGGMDWGPTQGTATGFYKSTGISGYTVKDIYVVTDWDGGAASTEYAGIVAVSSTLGLSNSGTNFYNVGFSRLSIDGAASSTNAAELFGPPAIVRGTLTTAQVNAAIALGKWGGFTTRGWAGKIHEVIFYDRELSDAEDAKVRNYLSKKWGLYPNNPPAYADADVNAYINAVEAADGAHLEDGIRAAYNDFITGCKADGIWDSIKASCILAGARTLAGALVPLKPPGPELWSVSTPSITDSGGSSGSWDAGTLEMSNTATGANSGYPRFLFSLPLTIGRQYTVSGRLDGDRTAISLIRLGVSGFTSSLSYNSTTGVFSGTVVAGAAAIEFGLNATLGAKSLTIGAISIKESFAPTNNNFVSGDYNRETGLKGDGSTKYLDSNRNNNADPQDSKHAAVFVSDDSTDSGAVRGLIYAGDNGTAGSSGLGYRNNDGVSLFQANNTSAHVPTIASLSGLAGVSRSNSTGFVARYSGSNVSVTAASDSPAAGNLFAYRRNGTNYSSARLAFYSIGESLDLALLDTRVSALITAIGAAI